MNLSLPGFCRSALGSYMGRHPGALSASLSWLLSAPARPGAPQLLFCLAAGAGRASYLAGLASGTPHGPEWRALASALGADPAYVPGDRRAGNGRALAALLAGRPDAYGDVHRAWLLARDPERPRREAVCARRPEVLRALSDPSVPCRAELARRLGVTRASVSDWLGGDDVALSPATAARLHRLATGDPSLSDLVPEWPRSGPAPGLLLGACLELGYDPGSVPGLVPAMADAGLARGRDGQRAG